MPPPPDSPQPHRKPQLHVTGCPRTLAFGDREQMLASSSAPASNSRASSFAPPSRRNTSCRCASSAAELTPAFAASTASRDTATTGICPGSASPFTALNPTRTPVKLPGPFTTTMASTRSSQLHMPPSAAPQQPPPGSPNSSAPPAPSAPEFSPSAFNPRPAPPIPSARTYPPPAPTARPCLHALRN